MENDDLRGYIQNTYDDDRQREYCIYCGNSLAGQETNIEHCPPKVFLDKPYSSTMSTIHAHKKCNEGFSLDEEYLASLIDSMLVGSSHPCEKHRIAINKSLAHNPRLGQRLAAALESGEGIRPLKYEASRVSRVIAKIADGHLLYEANEWFPLGDASVSIGLLPLISSEEMKRFEEIPERHSFPEIGSRAFQRLLVIDTGTDKFISDEENGWQIVQPNRYRYLVDYENQTVKIAFSEYLACVVSW